MGFFSNSREIIRGLFKPGQPTVMGRAVQGTAVNITAPRDKIVSEEDTVMGRNKQTQTREQSLEAVVSPQLVISPAFKLVVILVFVLILFCGTAALLLSIFGDPRNAALKSTSSVMSNAFTASVGAIIGLIGGKAVV